MTSQPQATIPSGRLESLDALRGFDMFWIVGGSAMVQAVLAGNSSPWAVCIRGQFQHPEWEGFRFFDLIMPLFLFMIGVSMPYSMGKRLERGDRKWLVFRHVLVRVVVLSVLGMMVNGKLLTYDPRQFQITYSVLQVLALGYLVASVVMLTVPSRWRLAVAAGLIAAYWLIQTFGPAPTHVVGSYAPGTTWGDWLNERLLGDWQGPWRRPWIVSMTTYGATALLGVFAGQVLRSPGSHASKLRTLVVLGVVCLAAGWVGSYWMPIIKKVWTSTYALYAGGWSYLALALFYLLIDVWGLRRWAFPFKVIGTNAIAAYMIANLFGASLQQIAKVFLGGLAQYVGPAWYPSCQQAGAALVLWLLLFWMYRTKTFVKV